MLRNCWPCSAGESCQVFVAGKTGYYKYLWCPASSPGRSDRE